MFRGALSAAAVLTAMLTVSVAAAETQATAGALLDATLQPYLTRFGLPALAAAVVKDGKVIASGVVGTRRLRADIPVTINDKFHIGSDTKAMTSLLAGMLVESGKLRWDTTVGEVFPELAAIMNPDLKGVTLEQLLSHTSGIPSDTENDYKLMLQSYAQDTLNLDEMRQWFIKQMAPQPLQSKPGEKFAYANMGYTLAGAIIERVSGTTWEELIVERVFDPLGLKTAGLVDARPRRRAAWPCSTGERAAEAHAGGTEWRQSGIDRPGRHRTHVRARLCHLGRLERRPGRPRSGVGETGDAAQDPHQGD
jgi:CubicO group peptidase (beta-lactamase class C family)